MWRKVNPHTLLIEMPVSSASTENITEAPQKPKTTTVWSSNSISEYPKIPIKNTIIQKALCTPMFTAALFPIAKIWKQAKYPSTYKQIMKMRYIYLMEYYSAIKNEILPLVTTWMASEIACDLTTMWNLKSKPKTKFAKLVKVKLLVTQSCPSLCDPMDRSPPGSSVHGISNTNTGVGSHCPFQGLFPIQESNPGLLHCSQLLHRLSRQGSP